MGKDERKTKTKKRRLVDEKFNSEQPLITSFEELPPKEYDIPDFVEPLDNSVDLNKDSSIIFEIKSRDNEFFYFNKNFQVILEMSVLEQQFKDDGSLDKVTLLYKKDKPAATDVTPDPVDPNTFMFSPSTSGLSIFKNIAVSYMNHTKDESLTFPQEGIFLNNLVAQDFFLSGSDDFEKIQNTLNNFTMSNDVRIGDTQETIPKNIQKMRYSKIHVDTADAPVIADIDDTAASSKLVGKLHYLYISRTPFVANNPYLQRKFRLPGVMIFPPNSTVRIIFYKNEIPLKYLGINKEVDIPDQIINTQKAGLEWSKKDIRYHIHKMQLAIHRVKFEPKYVIPTRFLNNITVNHFDLYELSSSTSQKIKINWRSTETPAYIVFTFLRQQDVIFSETHGLPVATNQFYLPSYLTTLTVRHQDYINEVFDGLRLENLDKQDCHPSKFAYIEYLKKHGFVPQTFTFENMFSLDNTIGTGCCNIFPVSLVGREIKADPQNKGLEVELTYTQSNVTKWFLSPRFVYIGQDVMTRQPDKQYKVDFKYY